MPLNYAMNGKCVIVCYLMKHRLINNHRSWCCDAGAVDVVCVCVWGFFIFSPPDSSQQWICHAIIICVFICGMTRTSQITYAYRHIVMSYIRAHYVNITCQLVASLSCLIQSCHLSTLTFASSVSNTSYTIRFLIDCCPTLAARWFNCSS